MDADFFISRAEREIDSQHNRVILTARNRVHADGLRMCCVAVAQWAKGKETIIRWEGNQKHFYRIPSFLAHHAKPSGLSLSTSDQSASQHEKEGGHGQPQPIISTALDTTPIQVGEPHSRDDELIIWAQLNKRPTGICSLTNGKVLFMNSLMPEFCGLAYDQIAVPDIASQFAKKDERIPTDLVEFNERLIKDKVINGSMDAFRTSGAFGSFQGRYSFHFLNGVPVRISEYESFEVIE